MLRRKVTWELYVRGLTREVHKSVAYASAVVSLASCRYLTDSCSLTNQASKRFHWPRYDFSVRSPGLRFLGCSAKSARHQRCRSLKTFLAGAVPQIAFASDLAPRGPKSLPAAHEVLQTLHRGKCRPVIERAFPVALSLLPSCCRCALKSRCLDPCTGTARSSSGSK